MILDFDSLPNHCIWLVGDLNNVDVLWNYSSFSFNQHIQEVECFSLFDADNLKCIYSSDLEGFFLSSNRSFWNKKLLVKVPASEFSTVKKAQAIKNLFHKDDFVFDLDKVASKVLFDAFILKYNLLFDHHQLAFVYKYCKHLKHLITCSLLASCEISLDLWHEFFADSFELNSVSWYDKFKNNTLLPDAVIKDNAISSLFYSLKAEKNIENKALIQFLLSNIKDGARVWDLTFFWKNLLFNK